MAQSPGFRPGTPREDEERGLWFEECCDDTIGDFIEEFNELREELPDLVEIYEEAEDVESLAVVEAIGSSVANMEATLVVLATLPTNETANSVFEDITAELAVLSEATANLR